MVICQLCSKSVSVSSSKKKEKKEKRERERELFKQHLTHHERITILCKCSGLCHNVFQRLSLPQENTQRSKCSGWVVGTDPGFHFRKVGGVSSLMIYIVPRRRRRRYTARIHVKMIATRCEAPHTQMQNIWIQTKNKTVAWGLSSSEWEIHRFHLSLFFFFAVFFSRGRR